MIAQRERCIERNSRWGGPFPDKEHDRCSRVPSDEEADAGVVRGVSRQGAVARQGEVIFRSGTNGILQRAEVGVIFWAAPTWVS